MGYQNNLHVPSCEICIFFNQVDRQVLDSIDYMKNKHISFDVLILKCISMFINMNFMDSGLLISIIFLHISQYMCCNDV